MNAKRDLEEKTRNAALSALAAFQSQYRFMVGQESPSCLDPSSHRDICNQSSTICIPVCSMRAAEKEANDIAFANISLGERFIDDSGPRIDTFTLMNDTPSNDPPDQSEFRLGIYYWLPPKECGEDVNKADWCPTSYPAFRTVNTHNLVAVGDANAIELRASFPSNNPITSVFASILGTKSFNVHATARAAILPRNDMFLIDLSRSMYRTNYLLRNKPTSEHDIPPYSPGTAAEFAFLATETASDGQPLYPLRCNSSAPTPAKDACCAEFCDAAPTGKECGECTAAACTQYIAIGPGFARDRNKFNALYLLPPDNPDDDDPGVLESEWHYQAHYRCLSVPTGWDGTTITNEKYFFDYGTESSVTLNSRPEPLMSVIEATHSALANLRSRNMSVDRIGVIGFDDDETNLIDNNPRYLPPSAPGSALFTEWLAATAPENYGSPNLGFLSKSLFPFAASKTDILQALREAGWLISQQPSFLFAKNSINIITDGLQNCSYHTSGGDPWTDWQRNSPCQNTGERVVLGIANLVNEAFVEELARRKISVNVILFGEEVRPHRLVRQNSAGNGCYDQIEDNALGAPTGNLVSPNWDGDGGYLARAMSDDSSDREALNAEFLARSAENPFLAPNQLYEGLVAKTKGLWLPVMKPYLLGNQRPVTFWNQLQQYCTRYDPNNPDPSYFNNIMLQIPDPAGGSNPVTIGPLTDDAGRLLYDPLGESVSGQMRRFVDQIIQSPYVLVP
jgi:hypothetical protein